MFKDIVDEVSTELTPQPTVAWKNLSQAERFQILNIYKNFINTNPRCQ